ncbi:MAG TPA: DUF4365 domain-containing protein [Thermodesulfobacteriota bacterium]|nr:DUF4365 domain-containing protein [Thermodesulfobacteriota bacterium]
MLKENESQKIGRAGERWFQYILPREWVFQPPREDIGVDGKVIIISSNKEFSGLDFDVQIKSSKNFKIKNEYIILKNIKSDRFKYWGASQNPFIVVAYDETTNTGYYTWLYDTFTDVRHIVRSKKETLTIKIPIKNTLTKETFNEIQKELFGLFLKKVTAMAALGCIVLLNKLSKGLCLLQYQSFVNPSNEKEKFSLNHSLLFGHIAIVEALDGFVDYLNIGPVIGANVKSYLEFTERIKKFRNKYVKEVSQFINEFEKTLYNKETFVVAMDEEKSKEVTPILNSQVLSFIADFTDSNNLSLNMGLPQNKKETSSNNE